MSRLIVKSLPKDITENKIRKLFSQKGEITDIQLKYTKDGVFRQFCFIGFRTPEEADNAQEYFHNSCIKTTKISVEKCASLGDSAKPKSWSKHAPDSSAFKKLHPETKEDKEDDKDKPVEEKKSRIEELLEKYKDDPMFEEYMQLNGVKDTTALLQKLTVTANKIEEHTESTDDSGHESTEESEEKIANKEISDMEYMKFLMKKSAEPSKRKRTEKQPKEKIKLYTVKLRGLAYATKKRDIKQFLSPLVPYTIRIPQKIKGIAYVGFKLEKQMKQALNKNKSFIGGKRIAVYEYKTNEEEAEEDGTNPRKNKWIDQEEALKNEEDISESGRIFLRNLSYTTTEDDIQQLFSKFGPITEVNLPLDKNTRKLKGFGIVTFLMPEHAVQAYAKLDGSILHGRMLHLLPGKSKDVPEENLEGLNYKQKKALKDKATAGSSYNWNTLFMGHNAVADVIAATFGTSKEAVLDWEGKGSAAVRLALGETQIVSSTKDFLEENGIFLDAFNQPATKRSKNVILVKNLPALTKASELKDLFAPHGLIGRIVLPPSGITAVVEFHEPSEARKAFMKLAYKKFKSTPLYLEWAPENTFKTVIEKKTKTPDEPTETSGTELMKSTVDKDSSDDEDKKDVDDPPEPDTTIFVKNLNFKTTEEDLRKHFEGMGKVNYAMIATKKDPKDASGKLSMGYGFIRFQHKASTDKALKNLQQSVLDGKSLDLKRSERTLQNDVQVERKKPKNTSQTGSKILVRNIPFEANKKELLELFQAFGEIKALRLPKKMTLSAESHRGFAFVDYATKKDAKRAFKSLSQSTHLYGRRLVLEWAAAEEGVEDIRKRTAKHFHPTEEVQSKKSVFNLDK